jgi:predicted DNA-binding protein YlxM (UPF0122 family)
MPRGIPYKVLSKEDQKRVRQWYLDDRLSIREIAEREGVSYTTMHRRLLEIGVTLRARGGPRYKGKKLEEANK